MRKSFSDGLDDTEGGWRWDLFLPLIPTRVSPGCGNDRRDSAGGARALAWAAPCPPAPLHRADCRHPGLDGGAMRGEPLPARAPAPRSSTPVCSRPMTATSGGPAASCSRSARCAASWQWWRCTGRRVSRRPSAATCGWRSTGGYKSILRPRTQPVRHPHARHPQRQRRGAGAVVPSVGAVPADRLRHHDLRCADPGGRSGTSTVARAYRGSAAARHRRKARPYCHADPGFPVFPGAGRPHQPGDARADHRHPGDRAFRRGGYEQERFRRGPTRT